MPSTSRSTPFRPASTQPCSRELIWLACPRHHRGARPAHLGDEHDRDRAHRASGAAGRRPFATHFFRWCPHARAPFRHPPRHSPDRGGQRCVQACAGGVGVANAGWAERSEPISVMSGSMGSLARPITAAAQINPASRIPPLLRTNRPAPSMPEVEAEDRGRGRDRHHASAAISMLPIDVHVDSSPVPRHGRLVSRKTSAQREPDQDIEDRRRLRR